MPGVVALAPVKQNLLAPRYKFFTAAANLIHQTNFCDHKTLKKVLLDFKDGVPLNL
jgi:hypothetical protein